jgi:hypothetical protein
MARRVGQIVRHGARSWLVRVLRGRDAETEKRKYLNQTRDSSVQAVLRFYEMRRTE